VEDVGLPALAGAHHPLGERVDGDDQAVEPDVLQNTGVVTTVSALALNVRLPVEMSLAQDGIANIS
jgi:hypothetical protein